MGALQVITGRVTNPGATITALTVDTGDSFTVKATPNNTPALLVQAWVKQGTIGVFRARSVLMHDQAQAIRLRNPMTSVRPLLPDGTEQPLIPQDALTVELSGSAAAIDAASLLVYYPEMLGSTARLITAEEVMQRAVQIYGSEQNLTTGATGGDYGGSQAISADQDQWKRNVDYALLGILSDTDVCTLGITGPDTGGIRIGVPGSNDPILTREFFLELARSHGRPMVPVINAANVGATTIDVATPATATAINVTLIFAQLAGGPGAVV